ncbi:unnamed protein product [Peronospora farinosa]|uniref:Uracil-DNA glycosylase-like domain-containing protein n=1 Tax=Peronospora farinosa TaxID=134698 RepID=A0AAV0U3V7_9STRA|nr:unnamed protein product [Peronospora farinosa]
MAGIFDRFRFDANNEDAVDTRRDAKRNLENDNEHTTMVFRKRGKHKAKEPKREKDSPSSGKWQERWHAICNNCFEHAHTCEHYPEHRLRLLIVGHNPSDHAWKTGYSYSNPTNRMWKLLTGTLSPQSWKGILPTTAKIAEQNVMPHVLGVGFTSIGLEPGNDASKYGKTTMEAWRGSFFLRLRRHAAQVCIYDHNNDIAMKHGDDGELMKCQLAHAPTIIAFSGKRQFSWLFSPPLSKIERFGKQTRLPSGWPHELRADSEIWVLPSSSGRAAMTTAQRTMPYQQLAESVRQIPWPNELVNGT